MNGVPSPRRSSGVQGAYKGVGAQWPCTTASSRLKGAPAVTQRTHRHIRIGLGYLAVSFVGIGLWATLATRSFYDDFPGFGRHWVADDGPYNAHLASDAGVGFLAVGVVLLVALLWMNQQVIQVALLAVLVHDLPHVLFHLRDPNAIGSVDQLLSAGGLTLGVVLATVLLLAVSRPGFDRSLAAAGSH